MAASTLRHHRTRPVPIPSLPHSPARPLSVSTLAPASVPPLLPRFRLALYEKIKSDIAKHEGGLLKFSEGYRTQGLHRLPNGDVHYREWIPTAREAFLIGDFSTTPPPPVQVSVLTETHDACARSTAVRSPFHHPRRLGPPEPPADQARLWHVGNHRQAASGFAASECPAAWLQSQGQPRITRTPCRPGTSHTLPCPLIPCPNPSYPAYTLLIPCSYPATRPTTRSASPRRTASRSTASLRGSRASSRTRP